MADSQDQTDSEKESQENQQETSGGGGTAQVGVVSLLGLFQLAKDGIAVKRAGDLLHKEIDLNRFITDPAYKEQIENAVRLANKYGRFVKKGDLIEKIPKIERIIERTNNCHSKLIAAKSEFLLSDKYYLRHLQNAYGLDDQQLKTIVDGGWARVRENPSLSIKDALTIEAENFSLIPVEKEVADENKGKKLTKEEIKVQKALVKKKLADKKEAFETSLTRPDAKTGEIKSYADYENKRVDAIIKAQVEENKQILAEKPRPAPSPGPQPAQTAPPPAVIVPTTGIPMMSSIPIPGWYSLRNVPIPTMSGIKTGLTSLRGLAGNSRNFLGRGLGFVGKKGLGRFASLSGGLGKKAFNRALDAFMPGLGMTLGKINDVIKSILGIDIEKTILVGAAVVIGIVASFSIIVPIIIGVGAYSWVTGDHPVKLSLNNVRSLSWNEFDKQYLTIDRNTQLSLNPNGHDDVEK